MPNNFGQNEIMKLSDELFFNIFTHNPDSIVFDFVKKYFPTFTKTQYQGGWTAYQAKPIPVYDKTVHSFMFIMHPYFDITFREGKLDLFALESQESNPGITDFHLWFFFDNETDGKNAFKFLCNRFEKVSSDKRTFTKSNKIIAQYTDQEKVDGTNCYEILLVPDELYDGKYKILFHFPSLYYLEELNGA